MAPARAQAAAAVPVAAARDFLEDVREEVNEYLDAHDRIISAQAAEELIRRWETGDPDLLDGWLRARSHQVLRDYIYTVTLSRGARRTREEQRGRFAQFADGIEGALQAGGLEAAREFYRYHSVTEGPLSVRKPLSALTANQVGEVRDRYQRAAEDNAFYAKILEAVRMRVAARGDDAVVSDVYSPEQLEKMFTRATATGRGKR